MATPTSTAQPQPRVGWVLNGDLTLASSRLQGHRIHEYFVGEGLDSAIAAQNIGALAPGLSWPFLRLARDLLGARFDAVMFQKPTWMMFKLSEMLRCRGVRTAAIQCDPFPGPYARYFDRVIVTSEALKDVLQLDGASVIDDLLEVPADLHKTDYLGTGQRLRLVWLGQSESGFVRDFFEALARHPLTAGAVDVITIGRAAWMSDRWSLDTVFEKILACDIAVLPMPEAEWSGTKSTNRLTQFMALGMPTVASPVRSYLQTGQSGEAFVVAQSVDEFAAAARSLMDPAARARLGQAARRFAIGQYSARTVGPLWVHEFEALLGDGRAAPSCGPLTRGAAQCLYLIGRLGGPAGRQLDRSVAARP